MNKAHALVTEVERGGSRVSQPNSDVRALLKGKLLLPQSVDQYASSYKNAKPFRHIVIDDMFPDELLSTVVDEMPPIDRDVWVHHSDDRHEKFGLRSAVNLSEAGFQLAALLHSASFLYFLSEVTGIRELLPDPYLQGSGYSVIPDGGYFDVHVDRNIAYETGLTRRLSLIIYLNKQWKHEYGGQLELWNSDGSSSEAVIEPVFNRTIIFEIAEQNFHGVPTPVACPDTRSRKSFAAYYHTVSIDGRTDIVPHSSIYGPLSQQQNKWTLRRLIKDVTPPMLLRGIKGVKGTS
jgi:2OG-Fe(II) oxygenase superfamily